MAACVMAAGVLAMGAGCAGDDGEVPAGALSDEHRAQLQQVLRQEDLRPPLAEAGDLRAGLASTSATVRRFAVRGVGRLEEPDAVPLLTDALADDSAAVRIEAANALAQSVYGQNAGDAIDIFHTRLSVESEPAVRGAIGQALGRLRPGAPDSLPRTLGTLVELTRDAPLDQLLPAMRGLESLARANRAELALDAESRGRIVELTRYGRSGAEGFVEQSGSDSNPLAVEAGARVRRLAMATLAAASALDADTIETSLYDADAEVRRLAAAAIGGLDDPTMRELLLRTAVADDAAPVRLEGLRNYGRTATAEACDQVLDAIGDDDPHVSLQAVDLLGSGCPGAAGGNEMYVTALLAVLAPMLAESPTEGTAATADGAASAAGTGAPGDTSGWHHGAHALVSLATLDPDAARASIPTFAEHPTWQVRMYAARAAAATGSVDVLERLVDDNHANVAEAALQGLSAQDGVAPAGTVEAAAVRALSRDDYQLLMTAARSLEGSDQASALPALLDALERITQQRRQTSRDPRRALLDRIGELGTAENADAIRPYLQDFDPLIAEQAAEVLLAWTGQNVSPSPRPPTPRPFPSLDELVELDRSRASLHMEGGGVIEIELHALEAPTNVARFVEQARTGYFDGLTFHRVVANFVIQGGSPGANEYMGAGAFSRDEISGARSHLRGTVGISTRGRDTGDSQIFVNLVDNVRLDYNYTIIGTVRGGMEAVDAALEGTTIERVVVEPTPEEE